MINNIVACFAASRYWQDRAELDRAFAGIAARTETPDRAVKLIVDGQGADALQGAKGGTLVIVPMSGAVQRDILKAAEGFEAIVLYAAYVEGNLPEELADLLLQNNAAPTLMDCWSVLRKTHQKALLAMDFKELARWTRLLDAWQGMKGKTLLLIGETEPWVISVSRDLQDYQKLGLTVRKVPQDEVAALYEATSAEEAQPFVRKYADHAGGCVEPSAQDIVNAGRMAAALLKTLEKHRADGLAIACFNLLSLGTTSCMGVSFINDSTDKIAACEGDLDSAVTMLMLRQLTKTSVWMANPGLRPDDLVNFSHCTAPLSADGEMDCPFILRSHHESGIGASLQVDLPVKARLTACRISARWGTFTCQGASSEPGPRYKACRTQLNIRFDDFDRYLKTALGCHQVFCFEDVREDFETLAGWMGLAPEA